MQGTHRDKAVLLHIGTEKTGSTSIQAAASRNRQRLREAGVLYPSAPGDTNHVGLTLYSANGNAFPDLRQMAGLKQASSIEQFKRRLEAELVAEVEASGCHTVVLSNEHLSSRLHTVEELSRLTELLKRFSARQTVVVYLRPQHELLLSYYSTLIKNGFVQDLKLPPNKKNPYYNYELMLAPWAEVFGEANIEVRIFDRDALHERDVVKDFLQAVRYQPASEFEYPAPQNPALDAKALEFLKIFNRYVPAAFDENSARPRGDIVQVMEAISNGEKLFLERCDAVRVNKVFEASNAAVARRFLQRPDGVLFPHLRYRDSAPPANITVEEAVRIASEIWMRKQRQVANLRQKLASCQERAQRGAIAERVP